MSEVIIGVDPHKLSATIEVVDAHEHVLGSGRFTTDQAGYAATVPGRLYRACNKQSPADGPQIGRAPN